jgi:hypothetical protein
VRVSSRYTWHPCAAAFEQQRPPGARAPACRPRPAPPVAPLCVSVCVCARVGHPSPLTPHTAHPLGQARAPGTTPDFIYTTPPRMGLPVEWQEPPPSSRPRYKFPVKQALLSALLLAIGVVMTTVGVIKGPFGRCALVALCC